MDPSSAGGITTLSSQTLTTQIQLEQVSDHKPLTVFSPPGIFMQTNKYPILSGGVLASTEPLEWLSIYDHPEAWEGLNRDAILSMRRHLYQFAISINARDMQPRDTVESLQTIALSVTPVVLGVEVTSVPSRHLHTRGGLLPCSPTVQVKSLDVLSDPEISNVAKRITEKDIPASESIWSLLDYDYSLDRVVRLMSVGLLGKLANRRLVPMKSAYKAIIDSFISRAVMELVEKPFADATKMHLANLFGDTFTIIMQPGEPRVDYVRIGQLGGKTSRGTSFEDLKYPDTDPRTSVFADHARFSIYSELVREKTSYHVTVFHSFQDQRNAILGPWIARAGVKRALETSPVFLDSETNVRTILESVLRPSLDAWAHDTPLLERLGLGGESLSNGPFATLAN